MVGLALESKNIDLNDIKLRPNEIGGMHFRSERFFKVDSRYFFSTREGDGIGPFESIKSAEGGLERYIDSMAKDGDTSHAKKLALSGNWAITMFQ